MALISVQESLSTFVCKNQARFDKTLPITQQLLNGLGFTQAFDTLYKVLFQKDYQVKQSVCFYGSSPFAKIIIKMLEQIFVCGMLKRKEPASNYKLQEMCTKTQPQIVFVDKTNESYTFNLLEFHLEVLIKRMNQSAQ
ncbi:hypothetical protein OXYTRIMIC_347 [Oxytricha trifallax]|uniref:Uncharacterized protein n=1 Tax=Oxytricha trifallax TaxID=1172189 RepID=A0A073IC69_9SPIT|nr:hypothetical protein OXYTRIMIC_347 [Oxytricha trifallax]